MRLHLGGHLNYFDELKRSEFEIELSQEQKLTDILSGLKIPVGEVFLVVVNGELVTLEDARIQPDNYVQLYPPMGGG